MWCVAIFCTTNIHSLFDPVAGSMCEMQFLILNTNYDYSNNINSADIRNQICNQYKIKHWIQKYKW